MSDKWRFDPYKDYTDDNEGKSNFQRFKNKKKKNNNHSNEEDFEKNLRHDKHHGRRQ